VKRIVLIACVSKKRKKRSKAEKLYKSTLFSLNLKYARKLKPDDIFILSAKHGLLSLNRVIAPYNVTLNTMPVKDRKLWAKKVRRQIQSYCDEQHAHFIFLAGKRYRQYLLPHMKSYEIPLEGMPIGKQLQFLKQQLQNEVICDKLHQFVNSLQRVTFPFDTDRIPRNGIYILFERDEKAHTIDRIVRVGTHTGDNQLRSRLQQHYVKENKDRSIFRKNIGRAILNRGKNPFLRQWNRDLTTRKAKEQYGHLIDQSKQEAIEKKVTKYIQNQLSFVAFEVPGKKRRLSLESKIISTVSLCTECWPSDNWLGTNSPITKIRESGMWQVNELYKNPLTEKDFVQIQKMPNTG